MKQQGWKRWWRAAGVRAIKTMAQTAVATIGAAAVLCEVSWDVVGSAAVLAGLLSLLTSLAGLPEGEGKRDGIPGTGTKIPFFSTMDWGEWVKDTGLGPRGRTPFRL